MLPDSCDKITIVKFLIDFDWQKHDFTSATKRLFFSLNSSMHTHIAHQPHSIKTKIINLCLNRSIWFGNLFINFAISCGFVFEFFQQISSSDHRYIQTPCACDYTTLKIHQVFLFVICGNKKKSLIQNPTRNTWGKKTLINLYDLLTIYGSFIYFPVNKFVRVMSWANVFRNRVEKKIIENCLYDNRVYIMYACLTFDIPIIVWFSIFHFGVCGRFFLVGWAVCAKWYRYLCASLTNKS